MSESSGMVDAGRRGPNGRDPDAIDFTSPQAADYAERVEALGAATSLQPRERLRYGADRGQQLDVYAPESSQPLPVLVFFHGGAWVNGHLGWLRFMAPLVTALPAVFVAGTYRLAPRCRWPAQYDDARAAIALVLERAAGFGGDPRRVVIGGHSAGGHLAALVALRERELGLRACMPVSAPFDLQYGDVAPDSNEGRVYRYLLRERAQDREASPIEYVDAQARPFHVVWGERDLPHIARAGATMVAALRRSGASVTSDVLLGASHFDTHLALADVHAHWYARLRDLLGGAQEPTP